MKLFTKPMRKDGKIPVTYVYDNGVRITKLRTVEQLKADREKVSA